MVALIEYIAKGLVDDPDQVEVAHEERDDTDTYELGVADGDLGKVIGRHGRTAKALRTVVHAAALRAGRKAELEIRD